MKQFLSKVSQTLALIKIAQGKVNILPLLGQLIALVYLPDIGNVELD